MEGLTAILAVVGMLLAAGFAIGLLDRRRFSPGWLLAAALLLFLNDAMLTRVYGLLPDVIGGAWNWQGKLLALLVTLAVAAHPAVGWRPSGLTFAQAPGSWRAALLVGALYVGLFTAAALAFPSEPATPEDVAFQLTMPGLEEEVFYRGVLLLMLDRAFTARVRFAGVDWGWGAVLSCALFGLAHAFGHADGGFSFDAGSMAMTAIPAFIAVWLRYRTSSVLLPIVLHNFGNAIGLML